MKKHFLILSLIICVLLVSILFINVGAKDYEDTLRVGIYYGSTEVNSLTIDSTDGFSVGLVDERDFIPVVSTSVVSVNVRPDTAESGPAYHVKYSAHTTIEELIQSVESLKASGIEAFPAFINSEYIALGGIYKNNNDALWAAENLSIKGTPLSVSQKAVCVFNTGKNKPIFLTDDSAKTLGIYHYDYENHDALLTISGSAKGTYRGGFECKILNSSNLAVTNIIPVESYLYSVVCREMSPSWEVEALKAQAVCARNFALGRINYHKNYGFDVCRTVCCQAYATTADQSESVHTAVDETRGELLFYEDTLVQAVYSSSMGAYTESVENVWGTPFPYLVSVENPYEDTENIYNGKWTKSLTVQRVTEIMNSRGYNIGDVTNITVVETTPSGSVLKLLVSGTNGSKTFEREACRSIFSEATYSQRYTVSRGGVETKPVVYITDGKTTKAQTLGTVWLLSKGNSLSQISGQLSSYDGKTNKFYSTVKAQGSHDTFVFSGEGWGHGVGMSQYGAKGMAQAGFTYDEILTHYYTDTHLEQAY